MFVRMFSSVTLQAENGTAFGSQSMLYLIKGRRENFVINTMLMRLSYPSIFQNEITCLYKLFTSLQINMTKKSIRNFNLLNVSRLYKEVMLKDNQLPSVRT